MSPSRKDRGRDDTIRDDSGLPQNHDEGFLRTGSVLGERYRIIEYIGRGGMGAVYRAHDLTLGADIAIKTLDPELVRDESRREAFRSEVKLARLVTHRNVCRIHDIVELPDVTFITMELIEGESLAEYLARRPRPPLSWTIQTLRDVARGLAAAHAAGVIHRDLKPGNVLLADHGGRAVVADFGIAARATRYGKAQVVIAGTRGYMSPEQIAGIPLDARSDVYSLGVLAYLMTTQTLPGPTSTAASVSRDAKTTIGSHPVEITSPSLENIPRELLDFVGACLQPDPEDRPRDAQVALRLLETAAVAAGEPTVITQESSTRRAPRSRAWLGLLPVLLALLLAGLWLRGKGRSAGDDDVRVALGEVSANTLPTSEVWLAEALERRVANELIDAWGVDVRKSDRGRRVLTGTLERDAAGRLEAHLRLDDDELEPIAGDSLRDIAEVSARRIAERAFPPEALRPTPQDLKDVGTTEVEAWRLLWRGRREARMQHWEVARRMFKQAVELDPGFALGWAEIAFTYDTWDRAYGEAAARAATLATKRPEMGELTRLGIAYAQASAAGNTGRMSELIAQMDEVEVEPREQLYMLGRRARAVLNVDHDEGEGMLEWLTEQFPNDAAAYKDLAAAYLNSPYRLRLERAVRHGARAVELAPDDVGARADYARALAMTGDLAAARAHMDILAAADPEAKQNAFAGGELHNSLFELHLALGEWKRAERDVLRLSQGSAIRRAQGQYARGLLELQRGAISSGLENSAASAATLAELGMNGIAADAYRATALRAWEAGEIDTAIDLYRRSVAEHADEATAWRLAFLQAKRSGRLADPRTLRELQESNPGNAQSPVHADHELLLAYERGDWDEVGEIWSRIEQQFAGITGLSFAAHAALARSDVSEAERLFERLATHPARYQHPVPGALAWVELGELREKRGDGAGARTAYQTFLDQWTLADPHHLMVVHARERLDVLLSEP